MTSALIPDPSPILKSLVVRPVERAEEASYQARMAQHHYLGAVPKIGETIWYVAIWQDQWLARIGFSAAALKCGSRDRWIGWDFRTQCDRLRLIANNSRFLILPEGRLPNLGSRVLSLVARRIRRDWQIRFGHPMFLIETFVDPSRFHGGVYRAANWLELGSTQGYRRTREGYSPDADQPKRVFVYPLARNARARLTQGRGCRGRCPAYPAWTRGVPRRTGRPLPLHRQGQSANARTGHRTPVRCTPGGGFHRNRHRSGLPDRARGGPEENRQELVSNRARPEQPTPERGLARTPAGHRSRPLADRGHALSDRLELRRGRCRIRTGFGSENITRLRRFAIGVLKPFQQSGQSIASMMRQLCLRSRIVHDYRRLTKNSALARQDA